MWYSFFFFNYLSFLLRKKYILPPSRLNWTLRVLLFSKTKDAQLPVVWLLASRLDAYHPGFLFSAAGPAVTPPLRGRARSCHLNFFFFYYNSRWTLRTVWTRTRGTGPVPVRGFWPGPRDRKRGEPSTWRRFILKLSVHHEGLCS